MLLAQYHTVSQFEQGESGYECGAFAVALNKYAGQHAPPGTPEDVDRLADTLWSNYGHPKGIGMQDLFAMLHQAQLHYQTIGSTELNFQVDQLNGGVALEWLRKGYPLICSVPETCVFDLELRINPYKGRWAVGGNHIITLAGIADDGNVLVADPASVGMSIPVRDRPFPRRYRLSDVVFVSMVAVTLPWMPIEGCGLAGWHDDGTTLTAPNQKVVVKGFRQYVLHHAWDPANIPLENERHLDQLEVSNPALGGGLQQAFRWTVLEWTQKDNRNLEMWTGQELLGLRQHLSGLQQQTQSLQQQIASLKGKSS
jgi:hypothetical protein